MNRPLYSIVEKNGLFVLPRKTTISDLLFDWSFSGGDDLVKLLVVIVSSDP